MRRDAPRSRRVCAAIERRSKGNRRLCGPQGFKPQLPLWDVVEVGPYRIGVLGLLTSERGIFRKDKMRGLAIEPVGAIAERLAALLGDGSMGGLVGDGSMGAGRASSVETCVDTCLGRLEAFRRAVAFL